jgi:hypothetical protein
MDHDTNGDEKTDEELAYKKYWIRARNNKDSKGSYNPAARDAQWHLKHLRLLLEDYRGQAQATLRKAGFDPDALEQADCAIVNKRGDPLKRADPPRFFYNLESPRLDDPAEPASSAMQMLRWTRLMQALMADKGRDLVTLSYAFNLGSLFKHAMLGMRFPAIAHAFSDRPEVEESVVTRRNRKFASSKRPRRTKGTAKHMVMLFAKWCIENRQKPTLNNVLNAMDNDDAKDAVEDRGDAPPFLIDRVDGVEKKVVLLPREQDDEDEFSFVTLSFASVKKYLAEFKADY